MITTITILSLTTTTIRQHRHPQPQPQPQGPAPLHIHHSLLSTVPRCSCPARHPSVRLLFVPQRLAPLALLFSARIRTRARNSRQKKASSPRRLFLVRRNYSPLCLASPRFVSAGLRLVFPPTPSAHCRWRLSPIPAVQCRACLPPALPTPVLRETSHLLLRHRARPPAARHCNPIRRSASIAYLKYFKYPIIPLPTPCRARLFSANGSLTLVYTHHPQLALHPHTKYKVPPPHALSWTTTTTPLCTKTLASLHDLAPRLPR